MKKKFDAVTFMRKRREALSREYTGLTWEQIEKRIQEALKGDPLASRHPDGDVSTRPAQTMSVRDRQEQGYGKSNT